MNPVPVQTPTQTPAMKHYYKNKTNVLAYYKSYYQLNKEHLKEKRNARYAAKKLLTTV